MNHKKLPTHDGRARVLLPKPSTLQESLAQIEHIKEFAETLGDREAIGIVDTVEGREVRSYDPGADAFVFDLAVSP